jgi:glutathione peroxidase
MEETMPTIDNAFQASATKIDGSNLDFSVFRGKPLLIVNTASKCGFTPQLAGLEEIHERFGPQGLVVIGFPCDQFAHQEPGTSEEIESFCRKNYGVSFQIMEKIEVNGPGTHPLFEYLKRAAPGAVGKSIKWNFTKFLVQPDGSAVKRFAPDFVPSRMVPDIEKALGR